MENQVWWQCEWNIRQRCNRKRRKLMRWDDPTETWLEGKRARPGKED
jgi:hypothetical protein